PVYSVSPSVAFAHATFQCKDRVLTGDPNSRDFKLCVPAYRHAAQSGNSEPISGLPHRVYDHRVVVPTWIGKHANIPSDLLLDHGPASAELIPHFSSRYLREIGVTGRVSFDDHPGIGHLLQLHPRHEPGFADHIGVNEE